MTNEEALIKTRDIMLDFEHDHIDTHGVPYEYGPEDAEPLRIAIEALEYRTPKKTKVITTRAILYCPTCSALVDWRDRYCHNCGQAIDWSEVEE